MTSWQRRINVDATSWRCIDVDAALHKRHVSAGNIWKKNISWVWRELTNTRKTQNSFFPYFLNAIGRGPISSMFEMVNVVFNLAG